MRKRLVLLLLMKLSGLLLHSAKAQSSLSLEHYYTMGKSSPVTIMPVASYQNGNGFYAESRYNYEELNTFSFYMGRTFFKESAVSYSISPIAGAVIGDFNGGSIGANISLGYKNFYIYTQPQYTFSLEAAYNNFIYSWTDITYSPLNWLSVGVSLQHTKPYRSKGFIENGLVIEAAYKKFTFPVYIYSPQNNNRSILFGANFQLNFRKKKNSKLNNSDSFKEVYPINIISNVPEKDKGIPSQDKTKSATESVANVRRVNVVVRTKSTNDDSVIKNVPERTNKKEITNASVKSTSSVRPVVASHPTAKNSASDHTVNISNKTKGTLKTESQIQKANKVIEKTQARKTLQPSNQTTYFALLLGPFKNEDEALNIKARLGNSFNREIILFSDNSNFKLRIPGFYDQKSAEMFSLNASNEGCKATATIIQYKLKTIDAIPLKNISKPFEATQLQ